VLVNQTAANPSDQEPPFEYRKWVHELQRRDAERAHDDVTAFAAKTNEAAIENANLALRTAVLINGGAAVSVLAFIGGLASQGRVTLGPQLNQISSCLVWFASGVAVAALAMGFSYFTNYCIAANASSRLRQWEHPYTAESNKTRKWRCAAIVFQILAIIGGFGSMGLFIFGMIEVKNAIAHLA
jgi:hypothetical protein